MHISKFTDYAIALLLQMQPGVLCSVKNLAAQSHLNLPITTKILKKLREVGFLESSRGKAGGYRLLARHADIDIFQLVASLEGKRQLAGCAEDCQIHQVCSWKGPIGVLNQVYQQVFMQVSLESLRSGKISVEVKHVK